MILYNNQLTTEELWKRTRLCVKVFQEFIVENYDVMAG